LLNIIREEDKMKKIYTILILGVLVISGIGVVGTPIEKSVANITEPELDVKIKGGFGITLTIENIGLADATEVWSYVASRSLTLPNGSSIAYGRQHNITLAPGESITVKYIKGFGLGLGLFGNSPYINVHVGCAERVGVELKVNATILFYYILLR
jgi:hypothetical protein